MNVKIKYEPLVVKVTQVRLEKNLADTVCISTSVNLTDWEDGGKQGTEFEEGGDIYWTY